SQHASLSCPGGTWLITDLASRAGVLLNALPVAPETPSPLSDLDLLTIGPWILRVHLGVSAGLSKQTISVGPDRLDPGERVDPVPRRELRSIARRRLDLLIDCASTINATSSQAAFARAIIEAAHKGTGFPRAAVFRLAGEEVEVLAETGEPFADDTFSRALIETAAAGQVARLRHDAPVTPGESIGRVGLQAAICAPIKVGGVVDAFLYLDDRCRDTRSPSKIEPDAAGFCEAICRVGGLALANQRRASLERLNAEIMHDVGAAAEAQRLLMPKPDGRCHGVSYSMRMQPGHFVAGDLFNILPLDGGRVGVYLGDVAGKGVGAAILMATTQTMLNAALRATDSPASALNAIEPELAPMLPGGRFISLWVGIIDPASRTVRFVDAGHGHWLVRESAEAAPALLSTVGGLPLGIDPDARYHDETVRLGPTGRIVLLSDGVPEQRAYDGSEFGIVRTIEILAT
ncbi:Serine phosphatase RsbU, regulator of sigma subunit, partial [hydrothermal vent metagenome]